MFEAARQFTTFASEAATFITQDFQTPAAETLRDTVERVRDVVERVVDVAGKINDFAGVAETMISNVTSTESSGAIIDQLLGLLTPHLANLPFIGEFVGGGGGAVTDIFASMAEQLGAHSMDLLMSY